MDQYHLYETEQSSSSVIKVVTLGLLSVLMIFIGVGIGYVVRNEISNLLGPDSFTSPFISQQPEKPLESYSIPHLSQQTFAPSEIVLGETTETTPELLRKNFSFRTLDKTMTGQVTIPQTLVTQGKAPKGIIVLLRGYVPPEIYQPGVGTRNAAAAFAEAGYLTVAPDFFGYGESDPEFEDTWKERFAKPVSVAELIATIEQQGLKVETDLGEQLLSSNKIGIWAHSNGGQIALTTLEITGKKIPTTLWAPVTAPFPYSILYFGDELADEGKSQRKWVALFEESYDVFDFTLTKHLNLLQAPLQLHQGSNDDAVLKWWSDEFVAKIKVENNRRAEILSESATPSALLDEIELQYFVYPGADHNLQPGWGSAISRDLLFFDKNLL